MAVWNVFLVFMVSVCDWYENDEFLCSLHWITKVGERSVCVRRRKTNYVGKIQIKPEGYADWMKRSVFSQKLYFTLINERKGDAVKWMKVTDFSTPNESKILLVWDKCFDDDNPDMKLYNPNKIVLPHLVLVVLFIESFSVKLGHITQCQHKSRVSHAHCRWFSEKGWKQMVLRLFSNYVSFIGRYFVYNCLRTSLACIKYVWRVLKHIEIQWAMVTTSNVLFCLIFGSI